MRRPITLLFLASLLIWGCTSETNITDDDDDGSQQTQNEDAEADTTSTTGGDAATAEDTNTSTDTGATSTSDDTGGSTGEDVPEDTQVSTDTGSAEDTQTSTDTGSVEDTAQDTGTPTDPYAAARQTCYDTINALRATHGKPPLARWEDGEACADAQADSDQQSGTPHGAFGDCGESGQNECLGHGTSRVDQCLQSMWDERLLDGCSGCDVCSGSYNPNCPDCDFYGSSTGDVCGHFVNMNADYFGQVSCGFSEQGGYVVINFKR